VRKLLRSWWTRSLAALLLLGVLGYWAAWEVLRSQWLAEQIRQRAIAEVEKATGGKAELKSFAFDWKLWRATAEGFVLHGREPEGSPPLVEAPRAEVDLKVLSFLEKRVNVAAVRLEKPRMHLVRDAEGRWNFPEPAAARKRTKTPVETVLDLAIGELSVRGAEVHYEDRVVPVEFTARDVEAQLRYERAARAYAGTFAMKQSRLAEPLAVPVTFDVSGPLRLDAAGMTVTGAEARLGASVVRGDFALRDWKEPAVTIAGEGTVRVADLHKPLRLPVEPVGEVKARGHLTAGGGQAWQAEGTAQAQGLAYATRGIRIAGVAATAAWRAGPGLLAAEAVRATALGGSFTGMARLESGRFRVEGELAGLELERLYAVPPRTAKSGVPLVWAGVVRGPVRVEGTARAFEVSVDVQVTPPEELTEGKQAVEGALRASYQSAEEVVLVEAGHLQLAHTRVIARGDPGKAMEFSLVSSDLDDLLPALRMAMQEPPARLPVTLDRGQVRIEGRWEGGANIGTVAGRLEAGPLVVEGRRLEEVESEFQARASGVTLRDVKVRAAGATLTGEGSLGLENWLPVAASRLAGSFRLAAPRVEAVAALAGQGGLPLTGAAEATARLEGTYGSPAVAGEVTASRVTAWGERVQAVKAEYRAAREYLEIPTLAVEAGPGRASGSASVKAPGGDWSAATVEFQITGRDFTLEQWQYLQSVRKGFRGDLDADAAGSLRMVNGAAKVSSIRGRVSVPNLQVENMPLGEIVADVGTKEQLVTLTASATLGGAHIDGTTEWSLGSTGFGLGQFTFRNVTLTTLQDLGLIDPATQLPARGFFEGEIGFSGPILDPANWTANAKLTRAELRPLLRDDPGRTAEANRFALRNSGPLLAFIDKDGVKLTTARMVGEGTDIQVNGSVGVRGRTPLNLSILGRMNLPALSMLEPDLLATGQAQVDVQIRGGFERPQVFGTMGLQAASFYLRGVPNGLEKVNGSVRFDRTRATIEKFSAVTGGGELTLGGFVGFTGNQLIYRLNAKAERVRVRYPEAVSTTFDGELSLTGTSAQSLLSGTVVVNRLGLNPKTDLGSILAEAARSTPADPIQNRALRGMQLDVKIETSPDAELQTSLTRDIQPEADLRLRGTAARPTVLGRVSVNEGEIQFFGNQYLITRGEISFFNPVKVEPVVNLDLETRARGITVTINLSGPPDKLNISYRSDPPLQSNEIVALLTVGRAPASATTAGSPSNQGGGLLQSGGNSLLGAAISAPLSGPINNRLQRFFGVSRIKIDPELNTITNTPQARLTIEQQLSREITVTYITNLNRTQNQIVRLQWDFSRDFSVLAVRDENGIFGIDFQYRKRFK